MNLNVFYSNQKGKKGAKPSAFRIIDNYDVGIIPSTPCGKHRLYPYVCKCEHQSSHVALGLS